MSFKIGSLTIYERGSTPEELVKGGISTSQRQKLQARAKGYRANLETQKKREDVRNILKLYGPSDPRFKIAVNAVVESERKAQVFKRMETQAERRGLYLESTSSALDAATAAAEMGDAVIGLSHSPAIQDLPSKLQKITVAQTKLTTTTSYIQDLLGEFDDALTEDELNYSEQLDAASEREGSDFEKTKQQFLDEYALYNMDATPSTVMFPSLPSSTPPTPSVDIKLDELEKRWQELNK